LDRYFSVMQVPNAYGRLQLGMRWHKLSLAHGCYWRRCAFCGTSLDYVCRYDPAPVALTIERMQRVAAETGCTGFHFVDEVEAPKLLKVLILGADRAGFEFQLVHQYPLRAGLC